MHLKLRNGLEGERFSRGDQSAQSSPAIQTDEVNHVAFQPMEERMFPCHVAATTHRTKEYVNERGCQEKNSMKNHETVNNLKMITEHQLSVIDLVSDGPTSKSDEFPAHEAHVAFSIEGLGKMATETPVHSPEPHVRTLSRGFASPSKAKRHAQAIKNFSGGSNTVDRKQDLMWDMDLPFDESLMEQPFCSKSPGEYLSNGKSAFSTMKKLRQPDSNNFSSMDSRGDNDLFYHGIARRNSFLPNILDEEEYGLSLETWGDQNNGCSDDYLNIRDSAKQEFTFEGHYLDNSRRDFNATGRSNILDIPDLYCQPFSSESRSNCYTADEIWTCKLEGISGVSQVDNNTNWPYFNYEDAVESLRSLSEESCLGTTVRDSIKRPTYKSLEKKGYSYNLRSPEHGWKTTSSKERYCSDNKSLYNEGRKYSSRMCGREAKSPSSAKIKVPDNKRSFMADYDDLEILNFDPFYHSHDTEPMFPAGHLWKKDIWCTPLDLQSDIDFRSTARKSFASTYAPCSKFFSAEYNSCQPFSDMKSHDNILPDTASGNSKPKLREDSKKCQRDPLDGLRCLGSAESSDTDGDTTTKSLLNEKEKYDLWKSEPNIPQDSMKGQRNWNASDDVSLLRSRKVTNKDLGKNTGSSPITNEKFDLQNSSGSNSFEVGNSNNTSGFEGRSSKYKSSACKSPEKDSLKGLETELDIEDKVSAVELSDISDDTESVPYKAVCKQDPETPVPCQDKKEEPEDSLAEERKVAKTNGIRPSCQEVLLIEGCVLQLLHVQVIKGSPDISQNKVL
ncbi:hypothetical protein LIER_02135 [Lithospermum erythrorhizon]|uniref:Uncharacterized protein n=1 Tax=Lithospermum erythrorhizon TaxID=34254 RepID=A0AAV3NPL7_LITER